MKKYIKLFVAVFSIALLSVSCNKTKSTSKRLMKAGEWNVSELSVDGVSQEELPHWVIGDCDIYNESCVGSWQNDEGGATDFIWQVTNNGDSFTISRQGPEEGLEHADQEVAVQCFEFSGTYDILESDKKTMKLTSTATDGFSGQTAIITLEKK
ncbi:MAG: hypothetical protein P8N52_02335 [Crocinitomicaceae bacterium]|nr:hypothetical protein [Crocinitomicaceae bacterium]MDG1776077.1 hypothetical protein [Crocinitomicaceae bacterium]